MSGDYKSAGDIFSGKNCLLLTSHFVLHHWSVASCMHGYYMTWVTANWVGIPLDVREFPSACRGGEGLPCMKSVVVA